MFTDKTAENANDRWNVDRRRPSRRSRKPIESRVHRRRTPGDTLPREKRLLCRVPDWSNRPRSPGVVRSDMIARIITTRAGVGDVQQVVPKADTAYHNNYYYRYHFPGDFRAREITHRPVSAVPRCSIPFL